MGLHNTWSGWRVALLDAINAPHTQLNVDFLGNWTLGSIAECVRNPISASDTAGGSTDCRKLPNGKHAQNYTTHDQAINQTARQLTSGDYPHLLKGLRDGTPEIDLNATGTGPPDSYFMAIHDDIVKWGDTRYAKYYLAENGLSLAPPPPGGGGGGGDATGTHKGWNDLRKSVNKKLPGELKNAQSLNAAALRSLHRAHKVKL